MSLTGRLLKILRPYDDADGPCVDLRVLIKAFPTIPAATWAARIEGGDTQTRTRAVKLLPMQGRSIKNRNIVILAGSLRGWIAHYNPKLPDEYVASMVNDLVSQTAALERYWRIKGLENRLSGKSEPTRTKLPKDAKPERGGPVNRSVFGVWG